MGRQSLRIRSSSLFVLAAILSGWPVFLAAAEADDSNAKKAALPADHAQRMAAGLKLFESQVRAVLIGKCVQCHGGEDTEGEFDMTTRETLLRGGETGAAIELGNPKASLLYQLISHEEEPAMPEEASKLPDAQIASIAKWIELGAPYDKPLIDLDAEAVPGRSGSSRRKPRTTGPFARWRK